MSKRTIVIGAVAAGCLLVLGGIVAILLWGGQRTSQAESLVPVWVRSTAPPSGVQVEIRSRDGAAVAVVTTPVTVTLTPGAYSYTASAYGYLAQKGTLTVPGQTGPVTLTVPALLTETHAILVQTNAAVQVAVDGTAAQTVAPDPAWVSLGQYTLGSHLVTATTGVMTATQAITVYQGFDAKVEFYWGARLEVRVAVSGTVPVSVTVDGTPYSAPVTYPAEALSVRSFAQVEVAAPGYLPWGEDVFLSPGAVTIVTATLRVEPTVPANAAEDVLAAYWHYWEVLRTGYETLDASPFATVMGGPVLTASTENVASMQAMGVTRCGLSASPHTPTVSLGVSNTAYLTASYTLESVIEMAGQSPSRDTRSQQGVYTLALGADGVWRVVAWTSTAPTPTPRPTPGGGGSGPAPTAGPTPAPAGPPNRGLISSIMVAAMNCIRPAGVTPLQWDQDLATLLQPTADAATAHFRDQRNYGDYATQAQNLLAGQGARLIMLAGQTLSRANCGNWDCNWPAYGENPCGTHFGENWAGDAWLNDYTRVGIAIGEPYWDGGLWRATVIVAVRP